MVCSIKAQDGLVPYGAVASDDYGVIEMRSEWGSRHSEPD